MLHVVTRTRILKYSNLRLVPEKTKRTRIQVITWQVKSVDLRYYEWFNACTRFQSIQKSTLILEGMKQKKDLYGVAAWEVTPDAICGKLTPDTMSGLIHILRLKNIQTQNLS